MYIRNYKNDKGNDRFIVFEDAHEMVEHAPRVERQFRKGSSWVGGDFATFKQCVTVGDESLVAESERFLSEIEDQVPVSIGWRNVDDVVGAIPNVPAFLAGHPQCMRRRERTAKETAPLFIYMDLTSSASVSARSVQRRGIVLLALVRMLVEHRSVELYVGTSIGEYRISETCMWHIDTRPLDLARAAYHISSTAMARGFGYGMVHDEFCTDNGHWPFADHGYHIRTAKSRLANIFPGVEILYIPPIYGTDEMIERPVQWLKEQMSQYVKEE